MAEQDEITRLLRELNRGDESAVERLFPIVYDELRRLARGQLARERPGHTLNTTALVHEAYLRLVDSDQNPENRRHFFGIAARSMRQILVNYAKYRKREKRGGGQSNLPLEEARFVADEQVDDVIALDLALNKLAALNQRQSRVVEFRYFAGLSLNETAASLGVSVATVKRDWTFARAWLHRELSIASADPG